MAKFSRLAKGGTPRLAVTPFPLLDGTMLTGEHCAVVPIVGDNEGKVLKGAREFAIEHGVEDPRETDPIYKLGRAIWICALGVVDNDPKIAEDKPEFFFDGGIAQVRKALDRDRIFLLARQQEAWQSEVAPGDKNLKGKEYLEMIIEISEVPEGVELPLERLPLATQRRFVRSLVNTLLTLPALQSLASSSSRATATSSTSSATTSSADAEVADAPKEDANEETPPSPPDELPPPEPAS